MDPDFAATNQHAGLPERMDQDRKNMQVAAARKGRPPKARKYFQPAENGIDPVVFDVLPPDPPSDGEAWVKPKF